MKERGRMGAHPGAQSMIRELRGGLPNPPVGSSRMPPLPMRPAMGSPGVQAPQPKEGGTLGIITPFYTIGIIVFFIYTTMKVR